MTDFNMNDFESKNNENEALNGVASVNVDPRYANVVNEINRTSKKVIKSGMSQLSQLESVNNAKLTHEFSFKFSGLSTLESSESAYETQDKKCLFLSFLSRLLTQTA